MLDERVGPVSPMARKQFGPFLGLDPDGHGILRGVSESQGNFLIESHGQVVTLEFLFWYASITLTGLAVVLLGYLSFCDFRRGLP